MTSTRMEKKPVFKNFAEYWYYARYLSQSQRKIIYKNFSFSQKEILDRSYLRDGWCDFFYRNEINEKIDELKEAYNYDILDIKIKALKGKSVYIPTKFWQIVQEQFGNYRQDAVEFVLGGLKATSCEENKRVCLVTYDPDEKFD